jgi:polysaccharide biosynthesis protein PslG
VASDGAFTSTVATVKLLVATVPTGGKTPTIGSQGITWWSGLSDADTAKALDMAKAEGITSMRIDISWYVVEMTKGTYDYSLIDPVVEAMASRNITVLAVLYGTPTWLSGTTDPATAPVTDAGRQAFAQFAAATAQHYAGEISNWEIWNEQNLPRFWPVPDATQYALLLKAVYPVLKAADPTSTVITGGLSPDTSGIDTLTFVRAMYAAGAGGYFDALGLHPYAFPFLPTMDPITAVHNVMVANGDGNKQIWLTEVGAPTGTSPWAETEDMQAQTIAAYANFARNNSYVGPVYYYSLVDTGTDPANPEDNFGLLRRDLTPKEAWGAWQSPTTAV